MTWHTILMEQFDHLNTSINCPEYGQVVSPICIVWVCSSSQESFCAFQSATVTRYHEWGISSATLISLTKNKVDIRACQDTTALYSLA